MTQNNEIKIDNDNGYDLLMARGFIQQCTDENAVRNMFAKGPVSLYVGYDPTADSLHVGHLFTLMCLIHLERLGHHPIVVLGGGTARVGDPSGKTELRKMISGEQIEANMATIKSQIGNLLDISEGGKTTIVDNGEWLLKLSYIDFLRDIGRHFSVNRMLAAEAYKQRLERGLSFIEFNYQLLQAYDFLELQRRYNCTLQMGGDDQWGNILAGVDLNRRVDQKLVQGLTFPLQTTATGEKMGKTAAGAVWLDPARLSPFEYYQYWVNTHDDDVAKMLAFFTFLPMPEITQVNSLGGAALNQAKSILAFEATQIVHGKDAAKAAHTGAMAGFGGRAIDPALLPTSSIPRSATVDNTQLPTSSLSAAAVSDGLTLIDLLVSAHLATSKGAARRLITQGAVRIEEERITDSMYQVSIDNLGEKTSFTLRAGKKRLHRFVIDF